MNGFCYCHRNDVSLDAQRQIEFIPEIDCKVAWEQKNFFFIQFSPAVSTSKLSFVKLLIF